MLESKFFHMKKQFFFALIQIKKEINFVHFIWKTTNFLLTKKLKSAYMKNLSNGQKD